MSACHKQVAACRCLVCLSPFNLNDPAKDSIHKFRIKNHKVAADIASAAREKLKKVRLLYADFACPEWHTYAGVRNTRTVQTKTHEDSAAYGLNYAAISILVNQCQGLSLHTQVQAVVAAVPGHLCRPDPASYPSPHIPGITWKSVWQKALLASMLERPESSVILAFPAGPIDKEWLCILAVYLCRYIQRLSRR